MSSTGRRTGERKRSNIRAHSASAMPRPRTSTAPYPEMENGQRSNAHVHRAKREDRTLESVSSLRNAQSGSVNEIKIWSTLPRRSREDAVSPPAEPVSSQSSNSEDSSNQRQKYYLPPTSERTIVETVSSLKEAASASITDLKEWAAT